MVSVTLRNVVYIYKDGHLTSRPIGDASDKDDSADAPAEVE